MEIKSPIDIDIKDCENFAERYIMGLESEFIAWNNGLKNGSRRDKECAVSNREFTEKDLLEKYQFPSVLDVGSGPISSRGTLSSSSREREEVCLLRACDPLAVAYDLLLEMHGMIPYVKTEFAFVERLTDKYAQDSFDIVTMRNALDHSYDPFTGIYEMLRVVKNGGVVRLIHRENEAERTKEYGLHQWNITCEGENSLVLWRAGYQVEMNQILGDTVKIQSRRYEENGDYWIRNDIFKKTDIGHCPKIGMNLFDQTAMLFFLT